MKFPFSHSCATQSPGTSQSFRTVAIIAAVAAVHAAPAVESSPDLKCQYQCSLSVPGTFPHEISSSVQGSVEGGIILLTSKQCFQTWAHENIMRSGAAELEPLSLVALRGESRRLQDTGQSLRWYATEGLSSVEE